jgi:hypothetical protein
MEDAASLVFSTAFRRGGPNSWFVRPAYQTRVRSELEAVGAPSARWGAVFGDVGHTWWLLDGGCVSVLGYGWGSHSYMTVDGIRLLRFLAHRVGVRAPRRLPEDFDDPIPTYEELSEQVSRQAGDDPDVAKARSAEALAGFERRWAERPDRPTPQSRADDLRGLIPASELPILRELAPQLSAEVEQLRHGVRTRRETASLAVWVAGRGEHPMWLPDLREVVQRHRGQLSAETIVRYLARSPDPVVRVTVAISGQAPTDVLAALATDRAASVRQAVALVAEEPLLRELAEDRSEAVRDAALRRLQPR